MIKLEKKEICNGCSVCQTICPVNCIAMKPDKMGFMYPVVNEEACTNCGLCEARCPAISKEQIRGTFIIKAYAAYCKDNDIRMCSSSGGIFTVIAKYILSQGGVVFGAAFDATFHTVRHIAIITEEEIKNLQGSKYVQSEIGNAYAEAKRFLKEGKTVLFTGTPCQIAGLKSYLGEDYDNLILQDIVCHGVPSPAIWDAYLTYLEQLNNGKTVSVSFRDKRNSWKKYQLNIKADNGRGYTKDFSDDLFMIGFLHDYYLRPSCYACAYKGINHATDITLADYWGIEKVHPEMDDDKGTSLILVHSEKGNNVYNKIKSEIYSKETELDKAVKYNQAMVHSANNNSIRMQIENDFPNKTIESLLKKYCEVSLQRKIKKRIKSLLQK